ncbi:hypothetical protein P7C73_g4967, partial [Tremellales sp. Uapishka_1]
MYVLVGALTVLNAVGRVVKAYRRQGGEVLFDGGSVVLLVAITYTQLNEVFPTITEFGRPDGLRTAVRDLANDNVMTAVMLTGVMLLQAGRYYAAKPSSAPPQTQSESAPPPSPLSNRTSTPFRELTEEEAMELRGGEESPSPSVRAGRRKNRVKR